MKKFLQWLLLGLGGYILSQNYPIEKRYIQYTKVRENLSLEYLRERHGIKTTSTTIEPRIIVLHYTGAGTANSNYNYFNKETIESARPGLKHQSLLNVSSQYLVDRDGTIIELMPSNKFARHTIGLNYCAIGIENIGSKKAPLTQQQIEANVQLIKILVEKHPNIKYLIGHHEYGAFKNSYLWKETNPTYFTIKEDPGIAFMQEVRKRVKSLELKATP